MQILYNHNKIQYTVLYDIKMSIKLYGEWFKHSDAGGRETQAWKHTTVNA
jgi:hypothetical protein